MKNKMAQIYVLLVGDKVIYVGMTTVSVVRRINHHLYCARTNKSGPKKLMEHIRAHGHNFVATVIEMCPIDIRFAREKYWISHYGTIADGCNSAHARAGGRPKGCSNPSGPDHYNYKGTIHENCRKAIIKANRGRKLSREHVEKIRQANLTTDRSDRRAVVRDDGVEFISINEAARLLGVTRKAIANSIRRNQRSCGFKWRYKEA